VEQTDSYLQYEADKTYDHHSHLGAYESACLDSGVLLIILSPVQAHAPDHLEPVLYQHLDEGKLIKVQQVHQVRLNLRVWLGALHTRSVIQQLRPVIPLTRPAWCNKIQPGIPAGSQASMQPTTCCHGMFVTMR